MHRILSTLNAILSFMGEFPTNSTIIISRMFRMNQWRLPGKRQIASHVNKEPCSSHRYWSFLSIPGSKNMKIPSTYQGIFLCILYLTATINFCLSEWDNNSLKHPQSHFHLRDGEGRGRVGISDSRLAHTAHTDTQWENLLHVTGLNLTRTWSGPCFTWASLLD